MKSYSRIAAFAALAVSAALPRPAGAWGVAGHRTVAMIAQDLLDRWDPGTLQKIHAILGRSDVTLDQIAVCPDIIRRPNGSVNCGGAFHMDPDPTTAGWHFIDIPISDNADAGSLERYCSNHGSSKNCVVDQIRSDISQLKDPSAGQAEKQKALTFLVHFVGDEHQPLHCATENLGDGQNDRGGNKKAVTFMGVHTNLHALWDDLISPSAALQPQMEYSESTLDPRALADQLEPEITDQKVASWTSGDDIVTSAALESFGRARNDIYPAYYRHLAGGKEILDQSYQRQMQPIAFERIEMAGVRLAYLLEQALGSKR